MEFTQYKIAVYVPTENASYIRKCLAESGCGQVGHYDSCSFSAPGKGRFQPQEGADPYLGEVGQLEEVIEEKVEVICPQENLQSTIQRLVEAHPYDEPAIDILPMIDYHSLL